MVPRGGWFKLQTDITDDPEVRKLDAEAFRVYVSILCILRQREYVASDLLVPLETIIYHSCLEKEQVLVRLREISGTPLGTAKYLKRTTEVRLNFPKWLDHQWEWIRKLRNFDGNSPEEVRKSFGISAPRRDEMRQEKRRRREQSVQSETKTDSASRMRDDLDILKQIEDPINALGSVQDDFPTIDGAAEK